MDLYINKEFDKISVKEFLYGKLGYSSNMVKRLKSLNNGILVNGGHVTVRYLLKEGDLLSLKVEDTISESSKAVTPIDIPITILYEDEYIILADKPSGMPTHPSYNHYEDSLASALSYYFLSKQRSFVFRAANRLDADTSGIVLVAKDKNTAYILSKQMMNNGFVKKYAALVHGDMEDRGMIDTFIKRKDGSTMLREVCGKETNAKRALTEYRVIQRFGDRTLVELSPITGRTHQLRVHMAHILHPICGDGLYGIDDNNRDVYPRLALHAYSLEFCHPITGENMTVMSKASAPESILNLFLSNDINERQ